MMSIKCSSRLLSRFPTAIDGHYCPSTALAQRWGLYIDHSTISQRYVRFYIENHHFTSTDLSVVVSVGTQHPVVSLDWNLSTTTVHRRRLVDSDQELDQNSQKISIHDQWPVYTRNSWGENGPLNPPHHPQDGLETSVTPEGSAAQTQETPLDAPPLQQEIPVQEDPLVVPQVTQGAPMEVVMTMLVNTINRQGQLLREQTANMRGQNELIREQNRRIQAVDNSRATSRISRSTHRRRPLSPVREHPRRNNHSPPPRNNRSPPRRNNRSPPPRNDEAVVRRGNARPPPREESPCSGDERHRGPLSRRNMDIPLPRGLENPSSLDKYDGTTDPDEHIQSVETALDYRNLRGSIKCKLFPLSLIRGASTWWRSLPPGSIDLWDELCRLFRAHFTTSKRHPKTVANLKAIIQGPDEPLRIYIERFNKEAVEVDDTTDKMKLYLLEDGLREGTKFQEVVGIVEMTTLDEFFELPQRYIKWKEKQKASEVRRPKNMEAGPSSQRKERRGDERRREGKVRKAKPPKSQFTHYTPMNAPRDKILAEIANAEFKSAGIRVAGKMALAISRPEDFLSLPDNNEREALDYLAVHRDRIWENFPGALVISRRGFNLITIGFIKRKFDELKKASPVGEIGITEEKESSIPLAFYKEEVPGGSPNFQIPLLVRAKMANFDVRRIIVDQGSSCDIIYSGLFKVLQLTEENLAMKSVKVKFLVVDCPSLYNGIIGRPTLAELFAVSSNIHLNMKYYTQNGQVTTINGDIDAARRYFEATANNLNIVATPQKKKKEAKLPGVNSIRTEHAIELDARTSMKERKQEKKAMKDDLLVKENYLPIPDGEFELVPLGEDPTKGIKIGVDLPDLVKRQLKACLRENAELFSWSAAEMHGIDPERLRSEAELLKTIRGQLFKDQSDSKLSKVYQKQRNSQSSEGYINYNLSSLMTCSKTANVKLLCKGRRDFTQRILNVYSCPSCNGNFSNVSMSFSTHINMPKKELMTSAHH
ncbi:hypothetical protein TSUD_374450 [Trifolium subterraneum]|uniref:Retrotransposon gag domain-containing protein n=1 Tax=Trifolium subterraneum TaxID=3900 RepID=A0A2Z6P450_TRISU|nr:hypothetical protein TSUD_374450 [Trifolium subterraneum]